MKEAWLLRSTADRPGGKHIEYRGGTVAITKARLTATYAAEPVSTDMADLEPHEIVIRPECLGGEYIDGKLRGKGLDARQIREARSKVREYLDLLLDGRGVEMTDDAYDMLVNMTIHLIEESSKVE